METRAPPMEQHNKHAREEDRETRRRWHRSGGQAQTDVTGSGSNIDRSIARQTNAARSEGRLDVHFHNSPVRMKATAQGRGALEKMRISQTPQMAKTGSDASAAGGGEE
jgi:hypothetical protein